MACKMAGYVMRVGILFLLLSMLCQAQAAPKKLLLKSFFEGEKGVANAQIIGVYPITEAGERVPVPNTFETFEPTISNEEILRRMNRRYSRTARFNSFVVYGDRSLKVAYPTKEEWAQGLSSYSQGQFFREKGTIKIRTPNSEGYLLESDFGEKNDGTALYQHSSDYFEALVGGRVLRQYWEVGSEMSREQSDYENYVKARYDIDQTWLSEIFFQGRVGSTHLAFSYIENKSKKRLEEEGEKYSNTYKFFSGFVSIKSLIPRFDEVLSKDSDLRFSAERSRTQGVASVKQPVEEGVRLPDADKTIRESSQFELDYQQYALLWFPESSSQYFGVEYSSYSMPTAIGFSDQYNQVVWAGYDPKLDMSLITFVWGNDSHNRMAHSNENFAQAYLDWEGGVGFGWPRLGQKIKDKVKKQTGKSKIITSTLVSLEVEVEAGFVLQRKYSRINGWGYQVSLGYKADYRGTGSPRTSEEEVGEDSLFLEYSRDELWHGPFVGLNGVF